MKRPSWFLAAMLCLLPVSASAATDEDEKDCRQDTDLKAKIRGCANLVIDPRVSNDYKAKAYFSLGIAHHEFGEDDPTIDALSKAIELGVRNAMLYAVRADAYKATKKYDLAIADANMAINLDDDFEHQYHASFAWLAYAARANAYLNTSQCLKAIADYSKAIELGHPNPNRNKHFKVMLHYDRSICYSRLDNFSAAKTDCEQALVLDPTFTEARIMLSKLNELEQMAPSKFEKK